MTDNSEWPKQITYKDVPALEYENGLVKNADTMAIMKPAAHTLFKKGGDNDPVKALETRYEMAVNAAMQALANGEDAKDIAGGAYSGWRAVVEAQKRLALDVGKGHASTRAAEFIGRAAGFIGDKSRVTLQDEHGNRVSGAPGDVQQLLDMVRGRLAG